MPIEANVINRSEVLRMKLMASCLEDQPSDDCHPAKNVNSMYACHHIVDTKENPSPTALIDVWLIDPNSLRIY